MSERTTWSRYGPLYVQRPDQSIHHARVSASARSGDWRHPVVGLWPVRLRDDLRKALIEEDLHKIEIWTARHGVAIADWAAKPVDPFLNVNTPEDVVEAEHIASQHRDI